MTDIEESVPKLTCAIVERVVADGIAGMAGKADREAGIKQMRFIVTQRPINDGVPV